ncbi:thiamine phosphate synthase [Allorhodopirellula solitaria]|uniref:Thiamine-phosphate synthase n=1 Tax=Allorhodopirellula solitaria TaxID=2527987 RepID=A0A5C5YG00_9BACT|nr:thiamine phosphate synthase [Allorhodopirellula solitaria]TWT73265.1 Thiamine-phosphate synthase [Allorhodopirellula solitaria]
MTQPPFPDHATSPGHRRQAIMRILDANANRAAEGLRAMEETARFVLDASSMTQQLKSLRHDFASALLRLPRSECLAARDSGQDVGTTVSTESEQQRTTATQIVAAAAGRTQQAMRCLEEYGKIVDVTFAGEIEQLRYRCYDVCARLEQVCLGGSDRFHRLQQARLYALVDACASEAAMIQRMVSLADAGVDIIQLRDSNVDDRTLFTRAVAGANAAKDLGVLWIINDRADIAAASGADGVHVGQDELPVAQVRRIVGADAIIGLSTHDIDQVHDAIASTADYIGCGPVFPGNTKKFDAYPGCDLLRQVTDVSCDPLTPVAFAIGGIIPSNVSEVVAAGFGRVAVTGALCVGSESQAAGELLAQLRSVTLSSSEELVS